MVIVGFEEGFRISSIFAMDFDGERTDLTRLNRFGSAFSSLKSGRLVGVAVSISTGDNYGAAQGI